MRSARVFAKAFLHAIGPALFLLGTVDAAAQSPVVEVRVDAIVSKTAAIHGGVGVMVPTGTYLRSGLVGAIGSSRDGISGRLDFINRFHLDPFRESRWAPYAGGGVSARFDADRKQRVYLMILMGIDGPAAKGITTTLEGGLGGGGRIGLIVRRATAKRR